VFINLFLSANDTIKIEYKSLHSTLETRTLADIISFLEVDYREIIITGNISNKNCELIETAIEEMQYDGDINSFTEYYITT